MQNLTKQELQALKPGEYIRRENGYLSEHSNYTSYKEYKVLSNKDNVLRLEFKYQNRIVRTRITINNTFREDGTQVIYPSNTKVEYRIYKIDSLNF